MIQENKDTTADSGKMYWKSLNDYAESPQFRTWVENEFPNGASLFEDTQRRSFMKLMAASFGPGRALSPGLKKLLHPSA